MTTVIVPLYRFINKRIKRFLNFKGLAKRCKICFSKHDEFGSKFIGLDVLKRKLFYVEQNHEKPTCIVIDVSEVEKCILKKQYESIDAGGLKKRKLHDYLATIFLQLSFKHQSKLVHLPFFEKNKDKNLDVEELEKKAKEWEIAVSKLLPAGLKERA
jgi:hypothetical protein